MVGREGEAVLDDDRLGLGLAAFEVHGPGFGLDVADALEGGDEVEVPEGAAEFAVRDRREAVGELLLHEGGDFLVLDGGERLAGELAPGKGGAGLCEGGRTQEAADDVGAVRRKNMSHGENPCSLCWRAVRVRACVGMPPRGPEAPSKRLRLMKCSAQCGLSAVPGTVIPQDMRKYFDAGGRIRETPGSVLRMRSIRHASILPAPPRAG